MIKSYHVMNRFDARRYCFGTHPQTSAIVSISTPCDEPAKIFLNEKNNIKHILRVEFNDVGADGIECMTRTDARVIATFVRKHAESVDKLIVHCDAGVSRSAGTCAAIMKYLTGDDSQIFDDPYYKPNMHCYRLMLEAMLEEFS